ncbi:cell division protein FtsH [Candidatus Riesia sp. GBBU]|nr:cell division protein FtsH [Candidatus Riesia sp. GBBU]
MKFFVSILCILTVILFLSFSSFIVKETERAIILRFGKVLRDGNKTPIVYRSGLHFKIPFIERIKILDARIQTLDVQADRYLTKENKDLIVDSYLKWKINDFSRYYVTTGGNSNSAEILLKRKFSDRLRSEFGRLNVKSIITDSRSRLTIDIKNSLNKGRKLNDVTENSNKFFTSSFEEKQISSNSMEILGIEVVDVRIKKIELPNEVSEAIYQRMRAEREAVARRHRSQGKEEAVKIRAIADTTATKILSEAESISIKLRGEGDAIATKLFAKSFSKDPKFYSFIRSLRAYEKSFQKENKDIIILDSNIEFFRYIKSINP